MGRDLAPKIAVKVDAGIAVDCIELDVSDGNIYAKRPVYAGKALINIDVKTEKKVFLHV